MQASILLIIGLVLMAFIINIPFGYIRQRYEKFSFMWFFLLHIPIPFIILVRIGAGIDWRVIPLTLCGSVAGQYVGGAVNRRRNR
jgi:hypothetical protein